MINARWGLHLDASEVISWVMAALGLGVLTRQTVVSPATAEKRAVQAQNMGYLQADFEHKNPPTAPRAQPPKPPQA